MEAKEPTSPGREEMKKKITAYYRQLTDGCGRDGCSNPVCASSGGGMQSGAAALEKSIALAHDNARLCRPQVEEYTLSQLDVLLAAGDEGRMREVLLPIVQNWARIDRFLVPQTEENKEAIAFDYDHVSSFFQFIAAYPHLEEQLLDSLVTSISGAGHKTYEEKDQLHKVLVLLSSPIMQDFEHLEQIRSFSMTMNHIKPTLRAALTKTLAEAPFEWFERVFSAYQTNITVSWEGTDKKTYFYTVGSLLAFQHIVFNANVLRAKEGRQSLLVTDFYNDLINEEIDIEADYFNTRRNPHILSLTRFPFALEPSIKNDILGIENEVRMRQVFESAMLSHLFGQRETTPYLILKVGRETIINDTIQQVMMKDGSELKKPLKVKFNDELGIDEGGVRKEFFQILLKQLFLPDYGMFRYNEDTRTYFFNPHSFESHLQFELIGILIGLAIYNGIILDLRFPHVVYKKLMGYSPTLIDVKEYDPELYQGLQGLLDFEGDVESVYSRTFQVSDEFLGSIVLTDLIPNGSSIPVTNKNRHEYVDLFIDHLFNKSVEKVFKSFQEGYRMVCDSSLMSMFQPEELELMVCGSPEFDIAAWETAAQYEDGYTAHSQIIKDFWEIVHALDTDRQRKLLGFCTGSDRAPIRGLGDLPFTISRNGPDSHKLPTCHTCFNHLLLPEYSSKEKLEIKLLSAIENSEGFGLR